MTDERIEELFQQVMAETCKDPLRRFAELVAEQTHTNNNNAQWYQEGYEAGQRDMSTKQENIDTSEKCVHGTDIAKSQWVGLTDDEIEIIVDANTEDDAGYDIFCDGQGVAKAIEAKLKEKNT